jgi:hypothetical protein
MANLNEVTNPIVIEISKVPWTVQGSVSASTTLSASDTISADYETNLVQGDGATTLTSTPSIANGTYNGQKMTIFGLDDTNLLTLQDESQLANSGLRLHGGRNVTLGKNDSLSVEWLSYQSKWVETSRIDSY